MTIAIIGGSGLSQLPELAIKEEIIIDTPWGKPSAPMIIGRLIRKNQPNKTDIVFLPRHGNSHTIPPHKINYRANILALKKVGVKKIISINAVGGITKLMRPNNIVVPDQIIDYTHNRGNTFYEDEQEEVRHIDFTTPYSETLRSQLIEAARIIKLEIHKNGVYGVTQGPRLETSAEILKLEKDGCNIVGMTGMPEASLAKELSIDYACYCLVVNWAAGKDMSIITMDLIKENLEKGLKNIKDLVFQIVNSS